VNIQRAIEQYHSGKLDGIEIRRNPNDCRQWFLLIKCTDGKSFILIDENNNPVVDEDLERLFKLLKVIGFREAIIAF